MGEFLENLKTYRSRIGLRDRTTAITAASIVIVLALVAFAFGSNSDDATLADGTTSDTPSSALSSSSPTETGAKTDVGARVPGSTGTGSVTAPGTAPDAVAPVPRDVAITDKVIKVGIAYNTDPGSANAAAGFTGIGQIDQKRGWDAMVKEVNKNPPFGRKMVPVYYSFTTDDVTSKGAERLYQEMCAKWTQDDKVFMVWGSADGLNQCLNKHHVLQLGGGGGFSWSKTYKDFPLLVEPSSTALDRMAEFEVDQLYKQHFFSEFKDNSPPYTPQKPADGKPKIGLIRYDQPSYKAASVTMKNALARHGLSLCAGCEFEIAYSSDNVPEQLDDATEVNAAIQNCKSRPGGPCTHLLFLGSTAGVRITIFYLDGAEKQAYRPRLGFNPLDAPTSAAEFLGSSSYPQLRDALLVTDGPGEFNVRTDEFKKCKALFEKAGETFTGSDAANKEDQIGGYCDAAWYFKAALLKAGRTLSIDSWLRAVDTVPAVPSAEVYLMKTKPGRHDGSGAIRVGAWLDDCNCFKPKTGIIPV